MRFLIVLFMSLLFSLLHSQTGDTVRAIYIDDNNNKWLGTNHGLLRFDGTNWAAYHTRNNIPGIVYALEYEFKNDTGYLWVGTDLGITLLNLDNQENYGAQHFSTSNTAIESNTILDITTDSTQTNYFATPEGLGVFESDQWSWLEKGWGPSESGIPNYALQSLAALKDTIYVGAENRGAGRIINEIDGFSGASYYEIPWSGMAGNTVNEIYIDRDRHQWFGTTEGVSKHTRQDSKKGWELYITENEGLINNDVRSIYEDSDGFIWMGTTAGLSKFNPADESFTNYTKEDGLSDDMIYDIAQDSEGILWFATAKGLTALDGENFTVIGTAENANSFINLITSSTDYKKAIEDGLKIYPNPVSEILHIHILSENDSRTQVHIYDIAGKTVKRLYSGNNQSGEQKITWNLTDRDHNRVPPGIYFVRSINKRGTHTKKILLK